MIDETLGDQRASGQFAIYRLADAPPPVLGQYTNMSDVAASGLDGLRLAGLAEGIEARILFDGPGFNVAYAWFKSDFPLFRHSHGPDCLYQVIGGSLSLGSEVLRKGDGFFLPAGTPYTFRPGPEGVEILEFRHEACTDTEMLTHNARFWEKAREIVSAKREEWQRETRPA